MKNFFSWIPYIVLLIIVLAVVVFCNLAWVAIQAEIVKGVLFH